MLFDCRCTDIPTLCVLICMFNMVSWLHQSSDHLSTVRPISWIVCDGSPMILISGDITFKY